MEKDCDFPVRIVFKLKDAKPRLLFRQPKKIKLFYRGKSMQLVGRDQSSRATNSNL
jgi:hypothetical protein